MMTLRFARTRQRYVGRSSKILRMLIILGTLVLLQPALAQAHFILMSPDSWMSQDTYGQPQKLGPCGNEGGGTPTGKITTYHPGQTIAVTIDEVIHHPGHYRVALAVNDRSELPAPPLVTSGGGDPCASAAIQNPPVFPVLADNMLPHTQVFSTPQTFNVTLPTDVTCTKCTLQVLEFMSSHGAPCFYYHCADIAISDEVVVCGDGQIQSGEQCDDNNTTSGDGCDSECHLECGVITEPMLIIGKLHTPAGDDTISLKGIVTLPSPVTPALDPLANGVRLLIGDSSGAVLDIALDAGNGWSVNANRTKWAYRNHSATPPGGINKLTIQDKSATTPGLLKFAVRGKGGSLPVSAANLPLVARLILGSSGGQCGDTNFASCAFNPSASKLKCQ